MNIGERIKHYRTNRGFTQQKLADSINKSIESIKKYEKGSINPPLDVLNKIAIALEVALNDLIDNRDSIDVTGSDGEYRDILEDFVFNNPDIFKLVKFLKTFDYTIKIKSYNDIQLISIFKNDIEITTIEQSTFEEYAEPLLKIIDFAENKADTFVHDLDFLYGFHTKESE